MDGVINVYKERGYTSADVVAKLRGILQMKKIGHTGTLDPEAEGVLPMCLGKATRLCGMITDWGKAYEAEMLLGVTTDTQDIFGKILTDNHVDVNERQIVEVCDTFLGEYYQKPPMYSALKYNGKKLYELARQGIEVERAARKVYIKSLHINEINLSEDEKTVRFTVECSKGTYVRTLCDDIGRRLGCGACMKSLTRTMVGNFNIDESLTLEQIEILKNGGIIEDKIIPVDRMFDDMRSITVPEEVNKYIYNGNKFSRDSLNITEEELYEEGENFRIYDSNRRFIGIYEYRESMFSPLKMFFSN